MIIDELQELLPLPELTIEKGGEGDWGEITNYFGKSLPTDYMLFVDRYGSGEIGNWLTVFNPFSKNPNINLTQQFPILLASIAMLKDEFPETCPYPLMFEPGGLLPWGISIDGDIFCWTTKGLSGKWDVVIMCRHSEPENFEGSMGQFLINAIQGGLKSAAIPEEWANGKIEFIPYAL